MDFLEFKKTSQEAANNKARECKKKRRQSLVGAKIEAQLKLLILRQGVVLERQRKHDPIMMARKAWETSP